MTERNYRNYSEEHYAAAKVFAGDDGKCSMSAALYATQSTSPDSTRIQDDVELLYTWPSQQLNVKESYPRTHSPLSYAKPRPAYFLGSSYSPHRARSRQCNPTLIRKSDIVPPTLIWDLSGGQYPRGKAFRKLIKRETHARVARMSREKGDGNTDSPKELAWGEPTVYGKGEGLSLNYATGRLSLVPEEDNHGHN